jgi:transketolase
MRAMAGMTVIAPADAYETARAVVAAMEWDGRCTSASAAASTALHKSMDSFDFEIGKAIKLREGTDITVIATGRTVPGAVEARKWPPTRAVGQGARPAHDQADRRRRDYGKR